MIHGSLYRLARLLSPESRYEWRLPHPLGRLSSPSMWLDVTCVRARRSNHIVTVAVILAAV
jgi:hypothetical protein